MVKFEPQFQIKCIGRGGGMKDLFWRLLTCIGIQRGLPACHWWVMELRSRYNPVIWVESRGWLLWKDRVGYRGTQQHVYHGRGYYILRGVGGRIWWCKVLWQKNLVTTLDLDQPIVVLVNIGTTFVGLSVATWLLMDEVYWFNSIPF